MSENNIKIINTSYHKKMTDRHLAQINFTAIVDTELFNKYLDKTSINHKNLGRLRFMESVNYLGDNTVIVFGRVSHGYGYGIEQDIFNSIMDSKGVKK